MKLQVKAGDKFNRLTIIEEVFLHPKPLHRIFKVQCDCGVIKNVKLYQMTQNTTKSCGCIVRENIIKASYKHGYKKFKEHHIWELMVYRCTKPKDGNYKNYGGRGITICEKWLGDKGFETFLEDLGKRPSDKHSLDRIDVNGNYCKENCRWATRWQQDNNKTNSHFVEWDDKRMTITEWERYLGFNKNTLRSRLVNGWSIEKTLTTPLIDVITNFNKKNEQERS